MMEHTTKPIHISLTDVESVERLKEATSMFKAMLAWAGERPDPSPAAQACYVLQTAKTHPELRAELYCQLMKQLSLNAKPSSAKYWELLALSLLTVPPGTGAEDFVHAFCFRHTDAAFSKRLIHQLHSGRYGEDLLPDVPPSERLQDALHAFAGLGKAPSRFSEKDLIRAATMRKALSGKHLAPPSGEPPSDVGGAGAIAEPELV